MRREASDSRGQNKKSTSQDPDRARAHSNVRRDMNRPKSYISRKTRMRFQLLLSKPEQKRWMIYPDLGVIGFNFGCSNYSC